MTLCKLTRFQGKIQNRFDTICGFDIRDFHLSEALYSDEYADYGHTTTTTIQLLLPRIRVALAQTQTHTLVKKRTFVQIE